MPIPDFQTIMLPLLKLTQDEQEHKVNDLVEVLSDQFGLTEEERKELLPSGQAFLFINRVNWARTYLKKAGFFDAPKRGVISITKRGIDFLATNPLELNVKILKQFPEFIDFVTGKTDEDTEQVATITPSISADSKNTPEESLEEAYQNIRKSLASELRSKIIELSPAFFEKLVVDLVVKMGYGGSIKDAGKAIGKSGDEGIDGTIKEDKLGLDIIYIQAKRWQIGNVVGRPEIQKFVGALAGQGAKKGIFITTSSFTKEALEYSPKNETKIVLVDGDQLAKYMIDYGLGVTTSQVYEVKRIDGDYFGEE
ncbi:MAG: restriction endonuclease [Chitinophagaceae bacterium]|nr:restriction endonuclease [Chitinophagaceae bacterium]